MTITVPACYPLRPAEADCAKRVGITEAQKRKWLLSMAVLLRSSNGAVTAALEVWRSNVEREFEGVEPCPICYMCVHAVNHKLPRLNCRQCRNKFHDACLANWFNTSNKSNCPVCQTAWGMVAT